MAPGSASRKAAKSRKRADSDDDEAALEAKLFGTSRKQARVQYDSADSEGEEAETGMGWMQDDQLFSMDLPTAPAGGDSDGSVSEDDFDRQPHLDFHHDIPDAASDASDSDSDSDDEEGAAGERPLWADPADDAVQVSLAENKRLRKLGRGKKGGEVVSGKELQAKLREQFERLHPKPQWASRRIDGGVPSMRSLLSSTASFIDTSSESRAALAPHHLDIQRLRNANEVNPTSGKKTTSDAGAGVVDFAWHPSTRVSVMAVAGGDRRVRFFNIDGHTNAALLTLHIPALPMSKATFHPSGSSLLLTGNRPFYYTYDLAAQRCVRSPRNLFGSTATPTSPNALDKHAFSPDGTLLAVAGRRGAVSILEWSGGGSTGVVVAELRSGRGGAVSDITWSEDSSELSVLGGRNGADVEVWDVGERKVVRQWKDDRAFGGLLMKSTSAYTAIGSSTGIVNLYTSSSLLKPNKGILAAEPLKSMEHLTTPITSMAFHPSGELFVSSSSTKRDALRMYHLPTGSAYSNWPTKATPLGRVNSVGFSAGGEYMAAGNTKGAVLLWSLKHFAT